MASRRLTPEDSPLAYFGSEVRHYRELAGYSQKELGEKIGYSEQAVGMVETANRKPTEDFAKRCDEELNTGGALVRLWPLVRRVGVQAWFAEYVELESQAIAIHTWDPQWIPGLFQTEEYARELITAYRAKDVEQQVAARIERQRDVLTPNGPEVWTVIDESALRRPVGSPDQWREQLERLAQIARSSDKWVVQVLPFLAGAHALSDGALVLLSFDDAADVAFADGPGKGRLVERNQEVRGFRFRYDLCRARALSPEDSRALIDNLIEELSP